MKKLRSQKCCSSVPRTALPRCDPNNQGPTRYFPLLDPNFFLVSACQKRRCSWYFWRCFLWLPVWLLFFNCIYSSFTFPPGPWDWELRDHLSLFLSYPILRDPGVGETPGNLNFSRGPFTEMPDANQIKSNQNNLKFLKTYKFGLCHVEIPL